jgi:hypothetical protein
MAELTRGGGGSHPQKRQYRRFTVHYPVNVKFDLGTSVSELRAFSNNISLGGVLLQSDSAIPTHCDVSCCDGSRTPDRWSHSNRWGGRSCKS